MSSTTGFENKTMKAYTISMDNDKGTCHGRLETVPILTEQQCLPVNHALIQVLYAGVCNTDLEILKGYMGFTGILGHEFVGRVVRVCGTEAESANWVGKRVCGDINIGCSNCSVCLNSQKFNDDCPNMSRNHCPNRQVLGIYNKNGTIAEYLTLPVQNLHEVPDGMDSRVAVFAEPLAAACRILEQGIIRYNNGLNHVNGERPDRVAILGDGKLGLMIAEVLGREHLRQFGNLKDMPLYRPTLFGKHKSKMKLVEESGVVCKLVFECSSDAAFGGVALEHAAKYDVVIDATGSSATLSFAAALCRPMGTLILKSTCATGEKFNASPFVINELRLVGSRCGPIDKALELLALTDNNDGYPPGMAPLRVQKYVTKIFPLAQAVEAIKCAAEKDTLKVLIDCSTSHEV